MACIFGANWVRGLGGDATHVLASYQPDVTLLAPSRSPGILDFPIIFATISAIANNQHTMVELCSTSRVIQDTTMVELKCTLVSLNRNRDGLF
jgi:hypothetical protein